MFYSTTKVKEPKTKRNVQWARKITACACVEKQIYNATETLQRLL